MWLLEHSKVPVWPALRLYGMALVWIVTRNMAFAAAAAKSLQLCPTLCDPIDGSPPGSPIPEILQARTMEWVAISFSNTRKWKVKVKSLTRVRLCATPWSLPPGKFQTVNFITCLLDEWMKLTSNTWLPLTYCGTSDKLFHFPGPPFSHL